MRHSGRGLMAGVDRDAAIRMAERLRHRGPDCRSTYVAPSGRCALGHARLRIIDLETGEQPMSNEDGSVWVVFNGEIYNFPELRARARSGTATHSAAAATPKSSSTATSSGATVLPERLDGMFALAIWDERRQRLFLARDRAGKKPLYIYRDDERLLFASEIKAILEHPAADRAIDPERAAALLDLRLRAGTAHLLPARPQAAAGELPGARSRPRRRASGRTGISTSRRGRSAPRRPPRKNCARACGPRCAGA